VARLVLCGSIEGWSHLRQRRTLVQACALGLFVALSCQPGAGAATTTGTLRGVVRDPDGAVIANATILIQHWRLKGGSLNHPVPVTEPLVYTDSNGSFSTNLAPGVYQVFVSFPLFAPSAREVRVGVGKETTIECNLSPSAFAKYVY
jgi:Carboxypeptidase regulatory-like domain